MNVSRKKTCNKIRNMYGPFNMSTSNKTKNVFYKLKIYVFNLELKIICSDIGSSIAYY